MWQLGLYDNYPNFQQFRELDATNPRAEIRMRHWIQWIAALPAQQRNAGVSLIVRFGEYVICSKMCCSLTNMQAHLELPAYLDIHKVKHGVRRIPAPGVGAATRPRVNQSLIDLGFDLKDTQFYRVSRCLDCLGRTPEITDPTCTSLNPHPVRLT